MRTLVTIILTLVSLSLHAQDMVKQGEEYFSNQEYDKAIDCFNQLLDEDLNNPTYHLWIGKSYYEKVKDNEKGFFLQLPSCSRIPFGGE